MRIEILGSGGAVTIPRPSCACRVCVEARERGVPYARTGPSVFVHGPNVLIDTPEETKQQLIRAGIGAIDGAFYSHWHPDHTAGLRVWETRNIDWRNLPPQSVRTDVYLPEQVATDFRHRLSLWDHLIFLQHNGVVEIHELVDGDSVTLNGTRITPFRLAEDYVYAFLMEEGETRVLIAPDELRGWQPPDWLITPQLDLALLPMGVVEFDVFSGERDIPAEHPVLRTEATWAETLGIIQTLNARRSVITHIEESDGLSYDDLNRLALQLQADGQQIEFAWDTQMIEV